MTTRLDSLDELLPPLLRALRPVAAVSLPWAEALGLTAAADVIAPRAFPPAALALRAGLAVRSHDLIGASPQSPAPLSAPPASVAAGETLPPGCDAIVDPASVQVGRFGAEALESVEPGAWVRLAGQDLGEEETIRAAGDAITPEAALAAELAGISHVEARRPAVALEWPEGPDGRWLVRRLSICGAELADHHGPADLVLRPATDDRPRLALRPGSGAWASMASESAVVELPARFDGMLGAWCALVLPILARLAGTSIATHPTLLARKLSSAIGWTEIALLRTEGGLAHPLAIGDAALSRIAQADAFAIIGAGSEGAPAGATIRAISLDRPFGRDKAER